MPRAAVPEPQPLPTPPPAGELPCRLSVPPPLQVLAAEPRASSRPQTGQVRSEGCRGGPWSPFSKYPCDLH